MERSIELEHPLFVISLDFEKMWGVFDKKTISDYGSNIAKVELVIDRLLELFDKYHIHCSWATVGMLFHEDLNSCKNIEPIAKPEYKNSLYSSYLHMNGISSNDFGVYYSGKSILEKIRMYANQEIATHTYSHFYSLEERGDIDSFKEDLEMALCISKTNGLEIKSIVFPRNQYDDISLDICFKIGLTSFRGTNSSWVYRSRKQADLKFIHRFIIFLDSYFNLTGSNIYRKLRVEKQQLINIPSSFFFRPFNPKFKFLEYLKMKRLKSSMKLAAENCSLFHLWWHPHNLGSNLEENLNQIESLLQYYSDLKKDFGMRSYTMGEIAKIYSNEL